MGDKKVARFRTMAVRKQDETEKGGSVSGCKCFDTHN